MVGHRSPSERFTYGLRRPSILAALANAMLLFFVGADLNLTHPADPILTRGWTLTV